MRRSSSGGSCVRDTVDVLAVAEVPSFGTGVGIGHFRDEVTGTSERDIFPKASNDVQQNSQDVDKTPSTREGWSNIWQRSGKGGATPGRSKTKRSSENVSNARSRLSHQAKTSWPDQSGGAKRQQETAVAVARHERRPHFRRPQRSSNESARRRRAVQQARGANGARCTAAGASSSIATTLIGEDAT
ncbi:hypothetical protein FGB62_87g083 [Gracilaria domingensis]|nr:hypothetical protein FGB62_87g083 [Gracilaria domingensis]